MNKLLPHNLPTLGKEESIAAQKVISSGWVAQGKEVLAFEGELGRYFDIDPKCVLAVSSGTAALYLALKALNISRKKNIGLPVYACSALRNAVGLIGANPIYFDSFKDSPNIDTTALSCVSGLSAIIAPSIFGIPVKNPKSNGIYFIEDVAQAFGSKVKNKKIGLRGNVGICSFYATKMITSGGHGGAVISTDQNLIDTLRDYREFDSRNDQKLRFNFQMTEIQAAIGRVQLSKVEKFIQRREEIFQQYKANGIELIEVDSNEHYAVKYRAVMRSQNPKMIQDHLLKEGIRSIIPIEKWELLSKHDCFINANLLADSTLSLPIYPSLTDRDVSRIINAIRLFNV